MAKHKLTDEAQAFIKQRDDNFGLKEASPYLILEQVILPMAATLPDTNRKEKQEIVGGLRRARASIFS